ncbi:hypothetical protein L1049_018765 [Liquidambar formosana]|uniref:Uncharacterized protein n=1 Tax=Liquidambar formosana TaxID=63359 RepID=A0AAP0WML7_LIQFO
MPGSHNDLNVLDHSPLFDTIIHDRMPPVNYVVNGHQHTLGYYLFDGIYPRWATLMQTIAHPTTGKEKLFAKKQETIRKPLSDLFQERKPPLAKRNRPPPKKEVLPSKSRLSSCPISRG